MTRRFLFSLLALLGEASTRRAPLTSRKSPWSYLSLQNEDDVTITASTGNSEVEEDIKLPNTFFQRERPKDINSDTFGQLLPIAKAVDEATGGWGLSYADLHPVTPRTTVGQAFLATNFCYAAGGLALGVQGEWFLGALTELAGIVSFWYHYSQLEFGKDRSEVRLALLIDYFTAGSALITGGVYMIQAGIDAVPVEALLTAGGSVICLSLCWVWEFGYPYIFWHSLWHILSALTGYLIGQEHISTLV
eukprot:g2256.t1 g2256   contig11:1030007-1031122(+)